MSPKEIANIIFNNNDYEDDQFMMVSRLPNRGRANHEEKMAIILTGLPGSGKSAVGEQICNLAESRVKTAVFDPNRHHIDAWGRYNFQPKNAELYSNTAFGQFTSYMNAFARDRAPHIAIYEAVCPTARRLAAVASAASDAGWTYKIIRFKDIYQDEDGVPANPHNVPPHVIASMRSNFYEMPPNFDLEALSARLNRPLRITDPENTNDPQCAGHIITSVLIPPEKDMLTVIAGGAATQLEKAYIIHYDDGLVSMEYAKDLEGMVIKPQ